VTKPFDADNVPISLVDRIREERALDRDRLEAREHLRSVDGSSAIIGRSPAMVRLLESLDTIAHSDAAVLIVGESGTGKELIARELHDRSPRAKGPFVAVNCAALPDTLLEAELFGHERGAFTGAVRRREGRFKLADGGTLLLDEIAEISPAAQAKLLRVLQQGEMEPVGASSPIRVDVRILSATHQDLKARVADGRFREDLYYRLNVLDLTIPPLRERRGDLPLLLEHFLLRLCSQGQEPPRVTSRAWRALCAHPFPGNVREFGHAVERAFVLSRGAEIDLGHLPAGMGAETPHLTADEAQFKPLEAAFRVWERDYLEQALVLAGGKKARAAELLGISRKNLWEKLRAYALRTGDDNDDDGSSRG
jgi:DNA-binding NtrC family response regulator